MTHRQKEQEENRKYAKSNFVFLEDDPITQAIVFYSCRGYDCCITDRTDIADILHQNSRYRADR